MDLPELPKLFKDRTSLLVFLDLLFLALPGVLVVFLLFPDKFDSLDWIKLILLATSFVLPFSFINTIFAVSRTEHGLSKEDDLFFAFSLGSIFAGLIFFIALALWALPTIYTKNYPALILALEVILLFVIWYDDKYGSKRLATNTLWGTKERPLTHAQVEAATPVEPEKTL